MSKVRSRGGKQFSMPVIRLAMVAALGLFGAGCVADDAESGDGSFVHIHEDGTEHVHSGDEPAVDAEPPEQSLLEASGGTAMVLVANSAPTIVAEQPVRLMTALQDSSGIGYLGSGFDEVEVVVRPADAAGSEMEQRLTGTWVAADTANLGVYVTTPTFATTGLWEVRVETEGQDLGGTLIEVIEESPVVLAGSPAPASDTPTASDDDGIAAISTDPEPDSAFYTQTIAEAIRSGQPSVVAFATPAFCQTALCGPTMANVKAAVKGREGLNVVHVEPFDVDQARSGVLEPVPAMIDWNLPTEPWVYVIDGDGVVSAAFEGIFSTAELNAALDELS